MSLRESPIVSLFQSRRLGKILSINLTSFESKTCSFNCYYCALGRTVNLTNRLEPGECYPLSFVKEELASGFKTLYEQNEKISGINIAGVGEPTLHPDFCEIVSYALELRKKYFSDIDISLFTNLSLEYTQKFFNLLNSLDRVYCKLDASDEKTFSRVNSPAKSVNFNQIINNLLQFPLHILSVAVLDKNFSSLKSPAFLDLLQSTKTTEVNLYEVDRPRVNSAEREVSFRVGFEKLKELKDFLETNTDIDVKIIFNEESRGVHDLLPKINSVQGAL